MRHIGPDMSRALAIPCMDGDLPLTCVVILAGRISMRLNLD